MSWLSRDLLFALRMLRRHPTHAAASLLALGLGLGLTTATFSIVDGLLLRGLPFPDSDRLMLLGYENPARGMNGSPVDLHDLADWASRQRSFEGLGAFDIGTATLTGKDGAVRLNASAMSADVLRLLRVAPVLGRGFTRRDELPGAQPVALVGWRVWRDRFGGDPAIAGRAIRLNGQPATVVGVMPEGFLFPREEEVWTPVTHDLAATARGQGDPVVVLGRLRRGVALRQAQAEMTAIARAIELEHPRTNAGLGVMVRPYVEFAVGSPVRVALLSMLGAVLSVLLIACCNVASLGMARAAQRGREIAVRTAMGAGRARIVAQMLAESMLLASAGAALGLGLAGLGIAAFNRGLVAMSPPFWDRVVLDPAALLVTLAATLTAGLVSGLAPALHASRTDIDQALRDEGRGTTSRRLGWFNQAVVVAELALSCVLLVGMGLMVKSVIKAQTVQLGFARHGILTFRVAVFPQRVPRPADRAAFYGRLLGRLAALPGVQAAAGAETLPGSGGGSAPYAVEGHLDAGAAGQPLAHAVAVSPGLFAAYGAPLLAGRDFGPLDTAAALPVVIVNRSLARREWPGQDPLGKRLRLAREAAESWRTVVGVAPDLKMDGLLDRRPEGFYLPVSQRGPERLSFALRTAAPPLALAAAARAAVAALDRDTPIYFVQTMDRILDDDHAGTRVFGGLFSSFGLTALLLAAVGIYGVIALAVERRTQEIGIRMALGAGRRDILAMLVRQALVQLGLGLGCGLPAAWAASRLLGGALFLVEPHDPAVFAAVIAVLALVALLATLVPAGRALRRSLRSPLSATVSGG